MLIKLDRHPVLDDAMAKLRDRKSSPAVFRMAANTISKILAIEMTKDALLTKDIEIETPLERTTVSIIDDSKKILLVPILRSGLAMLSMFQEVIPNYDIGFVGQKRNEITAKPEEYYCNVPANSGSDIHKVVILDPMIATGGSAVATIKLLVEKYKIPREKIFLVAIVAAPEGLRFLARNFPEVRGLLAAEDKGLNAKKFIVPGLGDFGDRFYGSEKPEEVI